jgi:death-on-curing protein
MSEPVWLSLDLVTAIHERLLREFGGAGGIREAGLLKSALDRPRNRWAYEAAAVEELAASYAFGIAKNHPFVDGNKRTAFLSLVTFLGLNGIEFDVPEEEAAVVVFALAAGEMSEEGLARWIGDRLASAASAPAASSAL